MLVEEEEKSVMMKRRDLLTGAPHYWKSSEADMLGIPTGAAACSSSSYL